MKIYNNNDKFGDCGLVESESFAALLNELDIASLIDFCTIDLDRADNGDPPLSEDEVAQLIEETGAEFLSGLSVVCEHCGEHGPAGDEDWTHDCTQGYIACNPSDGDHISDHDAEIRDTYDQAMADRTAERPAVRRVGTDDYLYVN